MAPSNGSPVALSSDMKRKGSSVVKRNRNPYSHSLPTTGPSFTLNSIPGKTIAEKRRVSRCYLMIADCLMETGYQSCPVALDRGNYAGVIVAIHKYHRVVGMDVLSMMIDWLLCVFRTRDCQLSRTYRRATVTIACHHMLGVPCTS